MVVIYGEHIDLHNCFTSVEPCGLLLIKDTSSST